MNNSAKILPFTIIVVYLLLITLSPSIRFIPYIEFHDCQRIIQLLLLELILLDSIFIAFTSEKVTPINNSGRIIFLLLIVLSITSTLISLVPRYAAIETTLFAALGYLALFVARLYNQKKDTFIRYLTYAIWASVVLYMVSFYVGYMTALLNKKLLVWPNPFYGFSNIRVFQQYQLWGLGLLSLPLLAFNLSKRSLIWLQIGLALWWILLFYAASRGAIIAWMVAMIITAIVYRSLAWPFLRIQLINAASGLAGYILLFKTLPALLAPTASTASAIVTHTIFRDVVSDRTDLWKVSWVMIKNFPFFGVGPMEFYFYNTFGTHPHNSVLQLASEWGLPATLIILTLTGYGLYCWMKRFKRIELHNLSKIDANLSILLLFTITANATYSLVDGVIVMPISQVLMFTMIGLMIGQYTEKTWATKFQIKPKIRPVFAGLLLILLTYSAMPELVRGITSYQRYLQPGERAFSVAPGINPRIWMQQRRLEN